MIVRFTNIQCLRALAAFNVVVFHSIEASKSYGLPVRAFSFLDGWGGNGVDLFFVISGFIMVYIQSEKKRSSWHFIRDRFFRIVPVYWLLTLLMAFLLLVFPVSFRQMSYSGLWLFDSLAFISRFAGKGNPILYLGWTIEYEMFFYGIFAIVILLSKNRFVDVFTSVFLLFGVNLLGFDPMFIEFIFGMFVGRVFSLKPSGVSGSLVCSIFVVGALFFLGSLFWRESELGRVLIYGLPSMLLLFGAIHLPQVPQGLITRLGDASYSLYLIQVFTIPVFYKIVRFFPVASAYPDMVLSGCVLFSLGCSILFFALVERRISLRLRPLLATCC